MALVFRILMDNPLALTNVVTSEERVNDINWVNKTNRKRELIKFLFLVHIENNKIFFYQVFLAHFYYIILRDFSDSFQDIFFKIQIPK